MSTASRWCSPACVTFATDENTDRRRRRPRTRAGVEVRAIAASARSVRGSGQRGHRARAQGPQRRHCRRRYRRPCSHSRRARTSASPSWVPRVRWSPASSIGSPPPAAPASAHREPRRAWKARRPSPRISSSATAYRPRATRPSPPTPSIRPTSARNGCRWSSRPTGSRPARASSSARPTRRRSRRPPPCSAAASAPPATPS